MLKIINFHILFFVFLSPTFLYAKDLDKNIISTQVSSYDLNDYLKSENKLSKSVLFFRKGEKFGVRIFAIKKGSILSQVGIKNGDIVLSLNGAIPEAENVELSILKKLKNDGSLVLRVERLGKEQKIFSSKVNAQVIDSDLFTGMDYETLSYEIDFEEFKTSILKEPNFFKGVKSSPYIKDNEKVGLMIAHSKDFRLNPFKLKSSDVLISANGKKISSMNELQVILKKIAKKVPEEGKVALRFNILRNNKQAQVSYKISTKEQRERLENKFKALEAKANDPLNYRFRISQADLSKALEDKIALSDEFQMMPYFEQGEGMGVKVFQFNSESLLYKIGLRNGDIIRSYNPYGAASERSRKRIAQKTKLFAELDKNKNLKLLILRNKKNIEIEARVE